MNRYSATDIIENEPSNIFNVKILEKLQNIYKRDKKNIFEENYHNIFAYFFVTSL